MRMKLTSNTCYVVALFGILYFLTFVIILPKTCKHMVYSKYFKDDDTKLFKYAKLAMAHNDQRYYKAQLYLAEFQDKQDTIPRELLGDNIGIIRASAQSRENREIDIAVGIISQSREPDDGQKYNVGYLTQTLASVHEAAVLDKTFASKYLFICNVDPDPDSYNENLYLTDYADIFVKHSTDTKMDKFLDGITDLYEKQKEDYSYCLEKALSKVKAKYVVILEDDVLVHKRFFEFVYHHLHTNLQRKLDKGVLANEKWAYIKLMYPNRWRGFSNTLGSYCELLAIGFSSGFLTYVITNFLLCVCPFVCSNLSRSSRQQCNDVARSFQHTTSSVRWLRTTIILLGGLYGVLVCYVIGRAYLLQLRLVSPHFQKLETPSPGCCTLAMLYPAHVVTDLTQYLSSITCNIDFALDTAVDKFANLRDMETFIVEPNIAVHVGMLSNLRAYAKVVAEYLEINII